MLKLKAAFAKKVPAETEYSSRSFHCEIECEIPDGLTQQQLDAKVHGVFDFVRASVEKELATNSTGASSLSSASTQATQTAPLRNEGSVPQPHSQAQDTRYQQPRRYSGKASSDAPASAKQLSFLLSLAKRNGWSVDRILQDCGLATLEDMPRRTCSQLIDQLSQAA